MPGLFFFGIPCPTFPTLPTALRHFQRASEVADCVIRHCVHCVRPGVFECEIEGGEAGGEAGGESSKKNEDRCPAQRPLRCVHLTSFIISTAGWMPVDSLPLNVRSIATRTSMSTAIVTATTWSPWPWPIIRFCPELLRSRSCLTTSSVALRPRTTRSWNTPSPS